MWREDKRQQSWLWVGALFLLFYFAEAYLFWGPNLRFTGPWFRPLAFWGLFGLTVIWIVNRKVPGVGPQSRARKFQSWILGVGITAGVLLPTYLVMKTSRNTSLGHAVLLSQLALAALVIGAMSYSPGWLAAAVAWAAGIAWIWVRPAYYEDYMLGASVGIGFVLVGLIRRRLIVRDELDDAPSLTSRDG